MLARAIGGDAVDVRVLAPPDRDAHYLLARPSMMLALRRADLLLAVGADLEVGWLPAAIRGAGNGRIVPGQPGYFEGAAQLVLLERDQLADRGRGDVHPAGNPHFYMDPSRMALLARAVAGRLAALDPGRAEYFADRAVVFGDEVARRLPDWRARASGAAGVVLYHKDLVYLAVLLDAPVRGYVEPVPGIPPTASHLRELVTRLDGSDGVILYTSFQSADGPEFLERHLGWTRIRRQLEVDLDADSAAYLDHIDAWVDAMTGSSP
jgi:zinc/manganese transport system substrate-binding protein